MNGPITPDKSVLPDDSYIFSTANSQAALAGAAGGFIGYLVGELVTIGESTGALRLILGSGIWSALIGTCIGAAILGYDNWRSLRGQWNRDLGSALPLFFALSFLGGVAGQIFYLFVQTSLTRGIGWSLMGIGIGAGIGLLRRDKLQAQRGAAGGAIGGFIGGFLFNAITLISSAGGGSLSRAVGLMITGAAIALLMRVVQDALKSAWLLGITTGPYEGREYPLNTGRVSVGRSEASDIALYREKGIPEQVGAFVFEGNSWHWQGSPVSINGQVQPAAVLREGDTIQFGDTHFRFRTRSVKAPVPATPPAAYAPPALPGMPHTPRHDTGLPAASGLPAAPGVPSAGMPSAWDKPSGGVPSGTASPGGASSVRHPQLAAAPLWRLVRADGSALRLPPAPAQAELGRAESANLVLSEGSVSSRHARLEVRNEGLFVCDLNSTNGTLVNGVRLPPQVPHPLKAGDSITFGREVFSVQN